MKKSNTAILSAAVAGIIGATLATASVAMADDGHCMGANSCKGKGGCAQAGKHDCAGKNGCKGEGYTKMSKEKCEKLMKKNKKIKFEDAAAPAAEEKKS